MRMVNEAILCAIVCLVMTQNILDEMISSQDSAHARDGVGANDPQRNHPLEKDLQEDHSSEGDLLKKALEVLKYDVGVWDCKWEYLDREGKVTQTVEGVEKMESVLGGKIIEMETEIPAGNLVSKSMRFYNPVTQRITLLSVGADGNHWELNQAVGSNVMTSKPHKMANGDTETIRFTITSKTEDAMEVFMERTTDDQNWSKVFRQQLKRRESDD